MSALPSGLVTFCFTDIEGSTQLFAKLGPRFLDLLEEHRRIIRAAVAGHGGAEVKTEGDGFFLAFGDPGAAVKACVEFQKALASHPWPRDSAIKVRAGLHIGEAEPLDNDYMTFAVHEAARIGAAAHGGQTILSDALCRALDGTAMPGVTLTDLGEFELKDIPALRVHQVDHPDLPQTFPPLRTIGGSRGYVPSPASSFIGRSDELGELRERLGQARLVTITGSGGVGKTRIAIELAHGALGSSVDGVWFVDLAPLVDGGRIPEVILDSLGVVRDSGFEPRAQLLSYLATRSPLIVLDNCEHLVDAACDITDAILRASPGSRIVATSRESLAIDGEVAWRLPSLDPETAALLFAQRAKLVQPAFDLDEVRGDVDHIVERLDGIPLAIELAAARTRVLTTAQVAQRLGDRFRLLTGGSRTALARQRTLEATVDWSYNLLDDDERSLLRHLSVLVGSFDLDAADAVWGGDALECLTRLVDKSMVVPRLAGDAIRYRLLETIRHYGRTKLIDAGEADAARKRHMEHFAARAGIAEGLLGPDEREVADALLVDADNLRAALEWAMETGAKDTALRIVAFMWLFWSILARTAEGLALVRAVLEDPDRGDPELLAQAQAGAAHMCWIAQEPNSEIERYAEPVVERAEARGPTDRVRWYDAWAALLAGFAHGVTGDLLATELPRAVAWAKASGCTFVEAHALVHAGAAGAEILGYRSPSAVSEQAVEVGRRTNHSALAYALNFRSKRLTDLARHDEAVETASQAVAAARRGPNLYFVIFALGHLGDAKGARGDTDAGVPLREARDIARDAGLEYPLAEAEASLARIALDRDDYAAARRHFEASESVLMRLISHRPEMMLAAGISRHGIGEVAVLEGNLEEARGIFEMLLMVSGGTGVAWVTGLIHNSLGWLAQAEGDIDTARSHHRQAIELVAGGGGDTVARDRIRAAALRGLAGVEIASGDAQRAAFLSGAASHVPEPHERGTQLNYLSHRRVLAAERAALGDEDFDTAFAQGRAAGLDVAI